MPSIATRFHVNIYVRIYLSSSLTSNLHSILFPNENM